MYPGIFLSSQGSVGQHNSIQLTGRGHLMAKSRETYEKVAETKRKTGDRAWAKAKSGEGGHLYEKARSAYRTADLAKKKAEEMAGKK